VLTGHNGSSGCSCGFAADEGQANAYNEEAFRYLLGVEERRAERSDRPFLLVLVEMPSEGGTGLRIGPGLARLLFGSLWRSLREADVIGWYREARIAGAVLTDPLVSPSLDVSSIVASRIERGLREDLPPHLSCRLHVRVSRIEPPARTPPECHHATATQHQPRA
jgi:hypothetical protein